MQSGNGIDLAAIHQLLTEVAQTVRGHSERFDRVEARLDSHTQKLNELTVAVNEHSRKLDHLAAVVDDTAAGLREVPLTLYQYHEAVVGQGMSLTGLEERVKRLEEHLHLDPAAV
jgi:ABC-type transporter Mla subunit MlaD